MTVQSTTNVNEFLDLFPNVSVGDKHKSYRLGFVYEWRRIGQSD